MNSEMELIVALEQAISAYHIKTGLIVESIIIDKCGAESAVKFTVRGSLDTILMVR